MKKTNIIIAIIFIVLVLVYTGQQQSRTPKKTTGGFVKVVPSKITKKDIKKIDIHRGMSSDNAVSLKHNDGGKHEWYIDTNFTARADSEKVTNFISSIIKLEGELRSSTSKVFPDYKITDEEALHIQLFDQSKKETLHLVVGKTISGQEGFVRLSGSEDVYIVDRNLLLPAGVTSEAPEPKWDVWADLTVLQVNKNDISKLIVQTGQISGEFVLKTPQPDPKSKEADNQENTDKTTPEKVWILKKAQKEVEVDQGKFNSILSNISRFQASKVINPGMKDESGINKNSFIKLEISSGDTRTIQIGKTEEKYFAMTDENELFEIPRFRYDGIVGAMTSLINSSF